MMPMANDNKIHLNIALNETIWIEVDHTRFKQVCLNLISNAIKYNVYDGSLTIEAEKLDDSTCCIRFCDTGIGIDTIKQTQLFESFNRLGNEGSATQGSGLGLAISKQVIELMKGQIGYQPAPKQGSCFWVTVPLV
jgi:signal transduction histidine kinase